MALVRVALSGLLMTVVLSACVVAPRPVTGVVYEDEVAEAGVAPPPPRAEVIGVAPYPGYFWVGGVWFWEGGHHVWHAGHWEAPRPGYRWVPHHWDYAHGAWHLHGGRWVR